MADVGVVVNGEEQRLFIYYFIIYDFIIERAFVSGGQFRQNMFRGDMNKIILLWYSLTTIPVYWQCNDKHSTFTLGVVANANGAAM